MRQRRYVSWVTVLRTFKPRFFATCFCLLLFAASSYSQAQEPAKEFVQALRDNGYYDLAMQYLEGLEQSDLIDPSFRKKIPLEKAETLIQSVNKIRDPEKWETKLTQAQKLLDDYTAHTRDPESLATAQQYQANLSYRQGRVYLQRSQLDRLTAQEKEVQLSSARAQLEKSLNGYLTAQETLKNILADFKVDTQNIDQSTQKRDELRRKFVAVRMMIPIIRETLSDTYTNQAKKTEQLSLAASEFAVLWDKYRSFSKNRRQALDSCYFAARTNFKLKKYKEALSFADELLNLPHKSNSRKIIRRAAMVALDCWNAMEPYPINQIIASIEPHVGLLDRKNKVQPEWLRIQLELAKAYRARATEIKSNGGKSSEVSRWNKKAAVLTRTVSRSASPVREESRKLLTEWNIDVGELAKDEDQEIKTFLDAKEKARELASELEIASLQVSESKGKVKTAKSEAEKTTASENLNLAKSELLEQSDTTLAMLKRALTLADSATLREDLNLIRYLQCYCYYTSQRYYESGIIGEFMLDRYANVDWSQQAAGLVIKSYSRLYDAAPADQKSFEGRRLFEVGNKIIRKWAGSLEAIDAASKMASISVIEKKYAAAEEFLKTIPADHPSRTNLSLKIGSSLWSVYYKEDPRDAEKLAAVISLLHEGVQNSNVSQLNFSSAIGSMRLVQAHLANNDPAKALFQLEKSRIAPLDLIKQKHPAITGSKHSQTFSRETYRIAINTYLAAMKEEGYDQEELTNKCLGALQGLKQILDSQGETGKKQLLATYKVIAARLNDLFEDTGESSKKSALAANIGKLLSSLEKDATDGRTVLWAGATMLQIADQLADTDANVRRSLYLQADAAFNHASSLGFAGDPEEATINLELGRLQALSKRGTGQFQAAIDALIEVLKEKPNYLKAQLDAAETLYRWGKAENLALAYKESLSGKERFTDEKRRKRNRIWGWRQLLLQTQREENMREVYFQVQYGHTRTMFEYGRLSQNPKAFNSAKKEITNFKKRFPEMGGDKWRTKFEALEQRINDEKN